MTEDVYNTETWDENLSASERTRFRKWLNKETCNENFIDAEFSEEAEIIQVNLRDIFVSPSISRDALEKLDTLTVRDEDLVANQESIFKEIERHGLLFIFGPPGSGKSTLIKAISNELCSDYNYFFNDKKNYLSGALPIPITLRQYTEFDSFNNLTELLTRWWKDVQNRQRLDGGKPLNLDLIQRSIRIESIPLLIMFDGIDELDSLDQRKKIINFCEEARKLSYKVLVTGREEGYKGLENISVRKLLPLDDKQITSYVRKWHLIQNRLTRRYDKDEEQRFLSVILSNKKIHQLARRPIFLNLMSHVNFSEKELPSGIISLYEKITDLYLVRQARYRLVNQDKKNIIRRWNKDEVRLILGHIAYMSHGDESKKEVISWPKNILVNIIKNQINNGPGRINSLTEDDADVLLEYFINPAGLLNEPVLGIISFSHLSFQYFLCAEYLLNRAIISGNVIQFFNEKVISKFASGNWSQVALIFISLYAKKTINERHFELIKELNISNSAYAILIRDIVASDEIYFSEIEQSQLFSIFLLVMLSHPCIEFEKDSYFPNKLKQQISSFLISKNDENNIFNAYELIFNSINKEDSFSKSRLFRSIENYCTNIWNNPDVFTGFCIVWNNRSSLIESKVCSIIRLYRRLNIFVDNEKYSFINIDLSKESISSLLKINETDPQSSILETTNKEVSFPSNTMAEIDQIINVDSTLMSKLVDVVPIKVLSSQIVIFNKNMENLAIPKLFYVGLYSRLEGGIKFKIINFINEMYFLCIIADVEKQRNILADEFHSFCSKSFPNYPNYPDLLRNSRDHKLVALLSKVLSLRKEVSLLHSTEPAKKLLNALANQKITSKSQKKRLLEIKKYLDNNLALLQQISIPRELAIFNSKLDNFAMYQVACLYFLSRSESKFIFNVFPREIGKKIFDDKYFPHGKQNSADWQAIVELLGDCNKIIKKLSNNLLDNDQINTHLLKELSDFHSLRWSPKSILSEIIEQWNEDSENNNKNLELFDELQSSFYKFKSAL